MVAANPEIPLTRPLASPSIMTRLHVLVVTVDHKKLGLMYIASALSFLVVAGLQASAIRLQLAIPNNNLVDPDTFNRLFTVHGTAMVFFVGMPIVAGLGNYLVPLMIGARDMAFPRLNAFGFWMFLFGGILLYFSYIGAPGLSGHGSAPDVGWFAYAPLTGRAFSRGNSTDYWTLSLLVSGIGSLASSINVIATAFGMRSPGMTLMRVPLFVWMMVVVSAMMFIAIPPLTAYYAMRVGVLPLLPYHAPGDPALGPLAELTAANHHALLLANHGPIVAAGDLASAADVLEELEETAKLHLLLQGHPTSPVSDDEVARLRDLHR